MTRQHRRKIDRLLLDPLPNGDEQKRASDRFPYTGTCCLLPIGADGKLIGGASITIVGRDLSTTGLSFSHAVPLSNKRAIVVLCNSNGEQNVLEIEVAWSKRESTGLYETGCRLVRKVAGHTIS